MTVTIKDVAKIAGVSVSTVSRVLNSHPSVEPKTRDKVAEAMRRLGFRPNQLARGLVGNRNYSIGLAISSNVIQFYPETCKAVHDEAIQRGYSVLLFHTDFLEGTSRPPQAPSPGDPAVLPTPGHPAALPSVDQLLSSLPVDGFIVVLTGENEHLLFTLSKVRRPLVVINRDLSALGIDSVLADETSGVYQAAHMLIQLGHRRIGFIRGLKRNITCLMRLEGYRRAVGEVGLDEVVSEEDDLDEAGGYRSTRGLLERNAPIPSGLIVINDLAAIGAMKAIREAGYRVPGDISVVGFDNRGFAGYLDPPLTTIRKPKYEMGAEAARIMFELTGKRQEEPGAAPSREARRLALPTDLIIRESCRPVGTGSQASCNEPVQLVAVRPGQVTEGATQLTSPSPEALARVPKR